MCVQWTWLFLFSTPSRSPLFFRNISSFVVYFVQFYLKIARNNMSQTVGIFFFVLPTANVYFPSSARSVERYPLIGFSSLWRQYLYTYTYMQIYLSCSETHVLPGLFWILNQITEYTAPNETARRSLKYIIFINCRNVLNIFYGRLIGRVKWQNIKNVFWKCIFDTRRNWRKKMVFFPKKRLMKITRTVWGSARLEAVSNREFR